jgi:enoyl-CoA hydratase
VESTLRSTPLGEIFLLQLENPAGYPRLERALLGELEREIARLEALTDLRGIVITGTTLAFAVGADVAEVSALEPIEALQFSELGQSVMRRIERCRKPVVAAVRGYCLGGGFDLAMACHMRIAAEDAMFGHPGGTLGIITGWGGTARLPRLAGRGRALEMLVAGQSLSASEALAARLVSRVVPTEETLAAAVAFVRSCRGKQGNARSQLR